VRDLLVTTHTPVLRSGQMVRTYGVARALAAHRGLDLLYARFDAPEPDAAFSAIPGIALHAAAPSRGARRLLAYADALASGVPAGFARGISPELVDRASALASAEDRGRVIADGPIAAAALRRLAARRAVIYNAHNLESVFRGDLASASRRHVHLLQRFERAVLSRASEAWMVSEPDLEGARALCPSAKLRYAPNVVDVAAIVPVAACVSERRALFVASFSYEPNRNGLRFLLDEVFPRVWAQLPDARLALVGAGLESPPSEDPRVETLGFVEDLAGAYASASCVVVPLLDGGGTPLKLIEALAYGLPVVATPRASSGLALRDGEHCLIAGDAPAFAAALVRVLSQGAPELARNGRELVERRYSIETLSSLLAP
jgi:glycosyltransferase involved in cell wall biosynthesis